MSHYKPYHTKNRAQRRLEGENGSRCKIQPSNATNVRDIPARNFTARPPKTIDANAAQSSLGSCSQDGGSHYTTTQSAGRKIRKYMQDQAGVRARPFTPHGSVFTPISSDGRSEFKLMSNLSHGECRSVTPMDDTVAACGITTSNNSLMSNSTFLLDDEGKSYVNFKNSTTNQRVGPIELVISNLDVSLGYRNLKRWLADLLDEKVTILNINIDALKDGSPIAIVKVASQEEAQFTISQLHHHKLGCKRISISYVECNAIDPSLLRKMVIKVLQDIPDNRMPLFKLLGLLESKYHINVSSSDITKLKDIIRVLDQDGRIVSLTPELRTSPSCGLNMTPMLYCSVHCSSGIENTGWADGESVSLPNINMSLTVFSSKLYTLLSFHDDLLPLLSFPFCYQLVFKELLPIDDNGVPLEYLITCVSGVQLKLGGPNRNVKYIIRDVEDSYSEKEDLFANTAPSMSSNIQSLCREFVDLLKMTERCQLLVSKLIPAYHHHFGRQCRVANYGFLKLFDLLQSPAVSKVVQILGYGTHRVITLTHRTQIRRFTTDVLKLLKRQSTRKLTLNEFPLVYQQVMDKTFTPLEYGLCFLDDLLNELSNNIISRNAQGDITLHIPKQEQTAEEIVCTKQFAEDMIKLLYHAPQCAMMFDKVAPAYHHYFGHQCKLADYGFSKLSDLFEAISDTVRVEQLPNGARKVYLTTQRALQVVGSQISDIIRSSKIASLPLEALSDAYLEKYMHMLQPQICNCESIEELISKLHDFVEVAQTSAGSRLLLKRPELTLTLTLRIWSLLIHPPHILSLTELMNQYRSKFRSGIFLDKLEELKDVIVIVNDNGKLVKLTPFYVLAAQCYHLLFRSRGQLPYGCFESLYKRTYGKNICYSDFNMNGVEDMISKMNFVFVIRCSQRRTNIILNQQLSAHGLPMPLPDINQNQSLKKKELIPVCPLNWWTKSRVIVPKPDTPPVFGNSPCYIWSPPPPPPHSPNLQVPLPVMRSPIFNFNQVTSPTQQQATFQSLLSTITSPHPTEVPLPDMLLGKDECNDSGVVTNSNITENEMDCSLELQTSKNSVGTKPKIDSSVDKV